MGLQMMQHYPMVACSIHAVSCFVLGKDVPTHAIWLQPTSHHQHHNHQSNPQLSEEGCRDCSSPAPHRFPRSFTPRGCNFFRCRGAILRHRFKAIEKRRWRAERSDSVWVLPSTCWVWVCWIPAMLPSLPSNNNYHVFLLMNSHYYYHYFIIIIIIFYQSNIYVQRIHKEKMMLMFRKLFHLLNIISFMKDQKEKIKNPKNKSSKHSFKSNFITRKTSKIYKHSIYSEYYYSRNIWRRIRQVRCFCGGCAPKQHQTTTQ